MDRNLIANLTEWGLLWLRTAEQFPDHAAACHHNATMNATHIMALEANQ